MLTACLSTEPPKTQEEIARENEMIALLMTRMQQANEEKSLQLETARKAAIEQEEARRIERESTLKNMLASQASIIRYAKPANFKFSEDGLHIDSEAFIDPEGEILDAGFNSQTGEFTYIIRDRGGRHEIKYSANGYEGEAQSIGDVTYLRNGVSVETLDGRKIGGYSLMPSSNGFLVLQENAIIMFSLAQGINTKPIPKGYSLTQLQRGDVDATRFVLLEKEKGDSESDITGGLFSGFKKIAKDFGMVEINDYALYSLENEKIFPINISKAGKNFSVPYDCVRQNDLVNKCKSSASFEGLFDQRGQKNWGHYYWMLDWFESTVGPVAVLNTGTELIAIDFNSETKYSIFERAMGVNFFEIKRTSDTVELSVRLGFTTESVPDLIGYMSEGRYQPTIFKSL